MAAKVIIHRMSSRNAMSVDSHLESACVLCVLVARKMVVCASCPDTTTVHSPRRAQWLYGRTMARCSITVYVARNVSYHSCRLFGALTVTHELFPPEASIVR